MKKLMMLYLLLICSTCYADVKLYHYVDKNTGEEKGISYSDRNGNPINNPDCTATEISESQKDFYINEQNKAIQAKKDDNNNKKNAKIKQIQNKLNLTDDEMNILLNK